MSNNLKVELLETKVALCKMINQFMDTVIYNGQEYFYNMCESAGEAAFNILGIEGDMISKQEFYKLFDKIHNELWFLKTGKEDSYFYEQTYLQEKTVFTPCCDQPPISEWSNYDYIGLLSPAELAPLLIQTDAEEDVDYTWDEEPYVNGIVMYYRTSDQQSFDYYEEALKHEVWWLNQTYKENTK